MMSGRWMMRSVGVLLALGALTACSDDPNEDPPPANNDPADAGGEPDAPPEPDVVDPEPEMGEPDPNPTPDPEPMPGVLCDACGVNEDCGGPDDQCLNLPFEDGGTCAVDCTADPESCPDGFQCALVTEIPEVRQCVPDNLLCNNPCEGVECPDSTVCNPSTGECGAPQGLCDVPCIDDAACGGENDQCVFLNTTGESICGQDCTEDQESCPEDFFCAEVGADSGVFQCVPRALTCIDRCSDVVCLDGEVCDPFTGLCAEPLGLCDLPCTSDGLCGGPDDICINLGGPDNENFCATACDNESPTSDCPLNYFCATLDNRELGVCVPVDLTCVDDRCDDVDCPDGFNCDVRTGDCVESEVALCESCGDLGNASCGGPTDLCLNLGDPGGVICSQDCTATGECPNEGYQCIILNNTTRRACIPVSLECRLCDGIECPEGATCNPLTGACEGLVGSCVQDGCPQGEVCNTDTEECEVIGELCSFDTRVSDCFGPVRKCSATRPGGDGVCALICDGDADCTPEAPNCVDLYRVGELCVPDGLGGPTTCGVTAPEGVDIGRPCGIGVRSPCENGTICIQNVEPDIDGFCSTGCDTDADCGGAGSCQALRGREGTFCVPDNCRCLTGVEVPDGENDIVAEVLAAGGLTRCSFSLDPTFQRTLDPATPSAPLKAHGLGGLVAQPLTAPGAAQSLQRALDAAADGPSPVRDAIVAAAARAGLTIEAREPAFALPDQFDPLTEGIRAFVQAAGGDFTPEIIDGDPLAVPGDVAGPLSQVLAAAAEVVEVRQGIADALGLDAEGLEALFANTPYLFLPPAEGAEVPNLGDEAQLGLLTDFDLAALAQAAADLAATVEAAALVPSEALDAVSIQVETPAGHIVIGGGGDTTWNADLLDGPIAVLIDVSGNDTYTIPVGATAASTQPVGLAIDLGGDDVYGYEAVADPNDQDAWLPSDAGGRFVPQRPVQAGNGPVSLSDAARQGAGRLGVGLLFDLGDGDDAYTSLRLSQGAGLLGIGALADAGGDDDYASEAFSQGAGLRGLGLLLDMGGNAERDTLRVWHAGQGFGTASGVGVALDTDGDTTYTAEPATGLTDVLYFSPPDRGLSNQNLAQGAGAGLLPADDRNPARQALGGGFGALYDRAGDDTYTSGTFAQGIGLHLGVGALIDADGADNYTARFGGQGYGELVAVGVMLEQGGGDIYNEAGRQIGALMGSGSNLGGGVLIESGGDDTYRVPNLSGGAGTLGGAGIFFELAGTDAHTAVTTTTWGFATSGIDDPEDPRADTPTYGLFIDAGGTADTYDRFDLENPDLPDIGDDRAWAQPDDNPLETGLGIDGEGLTGVE